MKKRMFAMALCLSLGLLFTSCKEKSKKDKEATESQHNSDAAEKADVAMNDIYKCPMDCEDGRGYGEEGKCPKCKMELKKVEKKEEDHKNETHKGEDNDSKDHGEDAEKGKEH